MQCSLGLSKFELITDFSKTALGTFPRCLSAYHIDLRGFFGSSSQNRDMIGQYFRIATHDGDMPSGGTHAKPQLANFEFAEKRDVVRQGAEFTLFTRCHNYVHRFAQDFSFRCDDLQ